MVANTLADARAKANSEQKVFKLQKRKAFTKEGKYFFTERVDYFPCVSFVF